MAKSTEMTMWEPPGGFELFIDETFYKKASKVVYEIKDATMPGSFTITRRYLVCEDGEVKELKDGHYSIKFLPDSVVLMVYESMIPPDSFMTLSENLPGMKEMAIHPVLGKENKLRDIIMDLNDSYKWTREQIADWLETLDIDLTFKENNEQD